MTIITPIAFGEVLKIARIIRKKYGLIASISWINSVRSVKEYVH